MTTKGQALRAVLAGVALAALVSAAAPTVAGAAKPKPKAHHAKTKPQPWVGSSLKVENQAKQYETVKLTAVTDPTQGADQFTTPEAGDRFVGVTISITNKSKGTDTGDANNNLTVVGSNKQVYQAGFSQLASCTNFANGQYTLPKGATETGCVAFTVPTGITVAKVAWNPDSGFSTNDAYWTAPKP